MPAGAKPRQVRAHEEMIEHAQVFAAPARLVTALQVDNADHVGSTS